MGFIEKGFPTEFVDEMAWSESNSRKPIYHSHKWFARRVGCTFRAIIMACFLEDNPILEFYENTKLTNTHNEAPIILDPFMGGGTTIVEGHRLGCKMVGVDINPMAWFITKKELEAVDPIDVEAAFAGLKDAVGDRILSFYRTKCLQGHSADVIYSFWVRSVDCSSCGEEVSLFKSFIISRGRTPWNTYYCPSCKDVLTSDKPHCRCGQDLSKGYTTNKKYTCKACGNTGDLTEAWLKSKTQPKEEPFLIEFHCKECGRGYKAPDHEDLGLIASVKQEYRKEKQDLLGFLIPDNEVPWKQMATMRPRCVTYQKYSQFFNERQLLSLSLILREILSIKDRAVREFFLLTFSDSLNANNMFCIYNTHARKLEPLFGGHYFSPPTTPVENNVWGTKIGRGSFQRYVAKGLKFLRYQRAPYEIRFIDQESHDESRTRIREKVTITGDKIDGKFAQTFGDLRRDRNIMLRAQTSEDLSFIPDGAVDAVVTDPPYYDNIMYSELSDFFYAWLKGPLKELYPSIFGMRTSGNEKEILVYPKTGKDDDFFVDSMTRVFRELHRVLRKEGVLVFVYQHKRLKAWTAILRILANAGFYVHAVYPTHGETPSGVRAHGINYNAILVCKKISRKEMPNIQEPTKERVMNEVKATLVKYRDVDQADALMIAMGKLLQIYTKSPLFEDGRMRADAVSDFESVVREMLFNRSSEK
ncbi:MAG: hypothetical protein ACFFD6_01040 [Candidatus Thorarchaeota archaeon]